MMIDETRKVEFLWMNDSINLAGVLTKKQHFSVVKCSFFDYNSMQYHINFFRKLKLPTTVIGRLPK